MPLRPNPRELGMMSESRYKENPPCSSLSLLHLRGYLFWKRYLRLVQQSSPEPGRNGHLLAEEVVASGEETDDARPRSGHLPVQVAGLVLPIGTEAGAE